ncbi:MAG: hypothetical protein PWP03_463 [Candidatus Woesearchaeota archaeon]|nr:hypothetical protein [Candidatus Woesearchaeota archaeon]MDN5327825.1 hypothetical protein [Candidatus Woesearchaeota archaeon]
MNSDLNKNKQVKVFWQDPYLKEFKTEPLLVEGNKVIPKETIIFSFSGGQEGDDAWINGIKVINSYYTDDGVIVYELEQPLPQDEKELTLRIDWDKRYKIMRLHSAAHVVYYFSKEALGFDKLIGSNVTSTKSRLDFLYPESVSLKIPQIEEKVNQFILEDHEIVMKSDEKDPNIRHWICEDYDMLCGGTHVKNTKEIGKLKLKRVNIGKGKERIEITLQD